MGTPHLGLLVLCYWVGLLEWSGVQLVLVKAYANAAARPILKSPPSPL
jgi:hypothetical protein